MSKKTIITIVGKAYCPDSGMRYSYSKGRISVEEETLEETIKDLLNKGYERDIHHDPYIFFETYDD